MTMNGKRKVAWHPPLETEEQRLEREAFWLEGVKEWAITLEALYGKGPALAFWNAVMDGRNQELPAPPKETHG